MILYLLFLGFCACEELSEQKLDQIGKPPPYFESRRDIVKSQQYLEENVLSMRGDIPNLVDSRRHFTEIVHVVYTLAYEGAIHCFNYEMSYDSIVNISAPVGISNPQLVITNTVHFLQELNSRTFRIDYLIHTFCNGLIHDKACNNMIDFFVRISGKALQKEAAMYLNAGKVAEEFLLRVQNFLRVSNDFSAHKYVILGKKPLKDLVWNLEYLLTDLFLNGKSVTC